MIERGESMNLDELLNPAQKEAATYLDSHLRIIAGAGSGKTRVLAYRIAYLIEEVGIEPKNILAITFTNKAANEMKERVVHLLGDYASGTLLCTIHSLCVRILRQNIRALNLSQTNFSDCRIFLKMPNLKEVWLYNCALEHVEVLEKLNLKCHR